MKMVFITGMSGAGKSRVIDTLEDIGYYCVDNMPVKLIPKFAELIYQSEVAITKTAMVVDVRGGKMFEDFSQELNHFDTQNIPYTLLFLDCDDEVLVRRYKETRRKHPLSSEQNPSLHAAISQERRLLALAKQRANYIIDTTHLSPTQLKEKINAVFLDNISEKMWINCMSFGFKYGYPREADLVFDVRCLPNPFYIASMRFKTGLEQEVRQYVMESEKSTELYRKLKELIDFLIPLYQAEGKSQLVIAFGCTGGKHRSVTFAQSMYEHLAQYNKKVTVNHRDISK